MTTAKIQPHTGEQVQNIFLGETTSRFPVHHRVYPGDILTMGEDGYLMFCTQSHIIEKKDWYAAIQYDHKTMQVLVTGPYKQG